MIIEPTCWGIECDMCGTRLADDGQAGDERELLLWARDEGWITAAPGHHFCSLDCLMMARRWDSVRDAIAASIVGNL